LRDEKQPCPDDDGPDGSHDALTGRCEAFDGDGCATTAITHRHRLARPKACGNVAVSAW